MKTRKSNLEQGSPIKGPDLMDHVCRWVGHSRLPFSESLVYRCGGFRKRTSAQFQCDFFGLRYNGKLGQFIDRHVWLFGAYAPAELDFLAYAANIVRSRGSRVSYVDIGANVGHHALFMSAHADEVLAFEPAKEACEQLSVKVRINRLSNVRLYEVALGHQDDKGVLGSGLDGNPGSRSLLWTLDSERDEVVQILRGDHFISEINAPPIKILKIDVEGFEKNVFAGLQQTLNRDRPIILFELVGKDMKGGFRSEQELCEHLYPGASLFALRGRRRAQLCPLDWGVEEAVCLPNELVPYFCDLMTA